VLRSLSACRWFTKTGVYTQNPSREVNEGMKVIRSVLITQLPVFQDLGVSVRLRDCHTNEPPGVLGGFTLVWRRRWAGGSVS
jgi:hypothetical protein